MAERARGGRGDFWGRGGRGGGRGRGRGLEGFDSSSGRGRWNSHNGGRGRGGRGGRGGFDSTRVYGDGVFPQPDVDVTRLEDTSTRDLFSEIDATSLSDNFPKRPGYGQVGSPVILWTNYLHLRGTNTNTVLYRYSIAFHPDSRLSKARKKRLIQLLLQRAPFTQVPVASDWAQMLISAKKIDLGAQRSSYDIEWYPEGGVPWPPATLDESPEKSEARRNATARALVQELDSVSLEDLMADLSDPSNNYTLKLEAIQALNVVLGFSPSSDPQTTTSAGGNTYYPFGAHPQMQFTSLFSGLQALRGYYTSVRTSVNRILVNLNVATAIFYKPGSLLEMMMEVNGGPPRNLDQHRKLANFIKKLRFETNYIQERDSEGYIKLVGNMPVTKRKVHTIFDISPFNKHSGNTIFSRTTPGGREQTITVEKYFLEAHGINLERPQAPCVNYGNNNNPKWIPCELCTVLGGQLARRPLLGDQTRKMIEFAARRPFQNAESIVRDGFQVTKINPGLNSLLTSFGINIDPKLLTVSGRVLTPPTLLYRSAITCKPDNGSWNLDIRNLGNNPFRMAKPLGAWNCLVINDGNFDCVPGGEEAVRQLLELFKRTLHNYGMAPGPVERPLVVSVNHRDLQNKDTQMIMPVIEHAMRNSFKSKPNFLFVLLPGDNVALYDSVKSVCDVHLGIPNVCNVASKFMKPRGQMQYFANVALKFNQKLGGVNHTIDINDLKPLDSTTIIFGIDVTHPSPGSSTSSPSIAGVVASTDSLFSQYPASMRIQERYQEMVADLEEMIIERLTLWQRRNYGQLPSKVIVYRDGVSEGQYSIVMREEYPQFLGAFKKLYGEPERFPKISLIVVGKRHHTRFYPTSENGMDSRTGNPKPGTVVDRGVTGEKIFDFFLLAHQGLQGASKPAHYVVLKDQNKLGADMLQNLTHNLCYTFARATRAVSVCPPAYYADLLCERGRSYLHSVIKGGDSTEDFSDTHWHRDVHPVLAETMYYL